MWQLFLTKAQSNLQAAERDHAHRAFDPCVSRSYFAAFQAAIAALLALADYRRRGHHWDYGEIAAEFTRRLIRQRKIFGGELASILEAMKQRYPDLADRAVVGPGNEGTVYVYIPFPLDDERNIEIHETMAEIGAYTVAETGIVIVLMPWSSEILPAPSS